MPEPIKIHGKFLDAGQTAAVLGVSKRRAKQLISMVQDLETGRSVKTKASDKASGSVVGNKKRLSKPATLGRVGKKRLSKSATLGRIERKSSVSYASSKTGATKKQATKRSSK
jgi:hypothetical protein